MARKKIVAGNWKMNMTPSQAVKLVEELKPLVVSDSVDVVYCVRAIDIVPVVEAVKGTNVQVGAENMYFEEKGAYTGEISAEMLVDAGVKYVVIGHSERRDYFKEDDVLLNKKVKKAIASGLTPILCCGETLEQRESGVTLDWIRLQIKSDLAGVAADDVKNLVIAYEPIWAIGTGKTATSDQAEEVCKGIRELIAEVYDTDTAALQSRMAVTEYHRPQSNAVNHWRIHQAPVRYRHRQSSLSRSAAASPDAYKTDN